MVKPGLVLLSVLVLFTPAALKHGCRDLKLANTSIPYGYYPTQWRPYPGCAEVAPAAAVSPVRAELLPWPKITLP